MHTERITRLSQVSNWIQKNERRLSTLVFVGGFIGDVLTFTLLNVSIVNTLFILYFVFAVGFSFLGHALLNKGSEGISKITRFLQVASPLIAQFFIGGLLSGFLIFYTKSSVVSISWPFILLLLCVFFGNEIFSSYRTHLTFQTTLLYFATYAYAIFAFPLLFHTLGTKIFLIATAASVLGLILYFLFLALLGMNRLRVFITQTIVACTLTTLIVVGAYVGNLIPPIPLTLKEVGIYNTVNKTEGGYTLVGEAAPSWWDIRTRTVHIVSGGELSVYSSVFAPGKFSVSIAHEWQHYNVNTNTWNREALITFPLSGGREGGYRGYSTKTNVLPGQWRILVKTVNGQTLGKITFMVQEGAPAKIVTVTK